MTERGMVERLRSAKEKRDSLRLSLTEAQKELDLAEAELLEHLENHDKERTAKYEDLGYVSRVKPKVYASYQKEQEQEVFRYLCSIGRDDIIKPTVHGSSLSALVREFLEEGKEVPRFINYYMKPAARLYM